MRTLNHDSWRRRGSSVVYSKNMLTPLIESGSMVSLREALSWLNHWPDDPPGGGSTVLVVGLEACLELMDASEGYNFLRRTIRPLIIEFQNRWDQRGLVFGFGCSDKKFVVDSQADVIFVGVKDNAQIRLSNGLWNGAASDEMYELLDTASSEKVKVIGGFHVRRLS
jgi:hypothetical protein